MLARLCVSKKLACGDLFRQDTFPLRLRRGRGNVQGNLAAQGSGCRKSPPAVAFFARCLRNVCAQGRKLPARPAKPGDTN